MFKALLITALAVSGTSLFLDGEPGYSMSTQLVVDHCNHQPPPPPAGYYYHGKILRGSSWFFVFKPFDPLLADQHIQCESHSAR